MYGKETGKIFIYDEKGKLRNSEPRYEPPLPTSIIKEENLYIRGKETNNNNEDVYNSNERINNGKLYHHPRNKQVGSESIYEPPLPNTILEIASQKGKHATQKPVDLIKWCLKYYSKEGDTILDPTMGSGSTGVACNEMNRKFIGIEMDETIFKVAEERVNV